MILDHEYVQPGDRVAYRPDPWRDARYGTVLAVNEYAPSAWRTKVSEKQPRGFAAMDPDKQREIARMGGVAAHEQGKAHEFTSEEGQEAGRRGGQTVSADRAHMAEIGRRGGLNRHHRKEVQSGDDA